MEKNIWIIGNKKKDMVEAQRLINSNGSMRAVCLMSFQAVERAVNAQKAEEWNVQESEEESSRDFEESGPQRVVSGDTNRSEETVSASAKRRFSNIAPSLILFDYEMEQQEGFASLTLVKKKRSLAGVPLFFMVQEKSLDVDEDCYTKGATVVLRKPFSSASILRLERTAWQYEMTKNYEKMLQKQAGDLRTAKEILRLNQQLKIRNDLLHQLFGRYFSDDVVNLILEDPKNSGVGGEKRVVTILMADLRGFTSLAETMEPEAVSELLNHFFSCMLEVITEHHGTVIEFLGDAILVVFGAPLHQPNHSADAVAAAIQMQNQMGEVNDYNTRKGYPLLEMGIGVHRGEVFIGNVGSERMMRYNVVGKTVNQCSRIESYSVGGQVLASRETLEAISFSVDVRNRMDILVKGIQRPMPVCEIIGIDGEKSCRIERIEFDELHSVKTDIFIELYPIADKKVMGQPVITKLDKISKKRARVELCLENEKREWLGSFAVHKTAEEREPLTSLSVYSDVEIMALEKGGKALFSNVYAKIIEKQGNTLLLHFTYTNQELLSFMDHIL